MRKIRPAKKNDQEMAEKALSILVKLTLSYPNIEVNTWHGAMCSFMVKNYIHTGFTYKQFCEEIDVIKNHYKEWFDK